jgi:hypothetical protein
MGAAEYDNWAAYYALEPWGAYRDNLHAGIIASVIAKAHSNGKRKPPEPGDFILRTREEQRRDETTQSLGVLRALAKRKGAKGGR